jgi:hypothetical protein
MRNLWCLEKISYNKFLIISATGIVSQSLFKKLKILDLENTLVVYYYTHVISRGNSLTLTQNIKHKKAKMWRRHAGNYVDKHCTIT